MMVFGHSEIVLRIVPAICGVLSIPVCYLIGKEFWDKNVGIISAALLTVSYFGIYYSQEARAYSVVLFVFSLAILFYLMALRTDKFSYWMVFTLLSVIAVLFHYYVLMAMGIMFLYAILQSERRNSVIALAIAVSLLLLPLFALMWHHLTTMSSAPTYGILGIPLVLETIIRFSSGGMSLFGLLVIVVYSLMAIMGFYFLFSEDRSKCFFAGTFLILSIVVSVVLSSKVTMNPRYLIFLLPVFYVVIAMGYPYLLRLVPDRELIYVVLALILVSSAPLLAGYYTNFTKEDWRGFAGSVQSITTGGDVVVLVPGYMAQPFDFYYSNVTDETFQYGASNGKELSNIGRGNGSVYFVVTDDINAENPGGDASAWLKDHTKIVENNTGISLYKLCTT